MADARLNPIPDDLREAFCQAVIELGSPGTPAEVRWGDVDVPVSAICGFVNNEHYAPAEMPEALVKLILELRKHDPDNPMLRDRTFQAGARYVVEVIEQRKQERQEVDRMTGRSRNE